MAEHEPILLAEALLDSALDQTEPLGLDEVLQRALENAAHVVAHDASSVMLVDGEEAWIAARHGKLASSDQQAIQAIRLSINETANLRAIVETQRPLVIADTQEYLGWIDHAETPGIRSVVCAPISIRDEVIGFIILDSATPDAFDETAAERLMAFADQAALAIHNARLYQDMTLHAETLAERNRELELSAHTVAHDLPNLLQIVIVCASLINEDHRDEISDEVSDYLTLIETYSMKMSHMIDSLLMPSQVRVADKIKRIEVKPLVEAALSRYAVQIKARGIAVDLEGEFPPVLGSGVWLEEVFANLLQNAINYIGEDNPDPRVAVRGARHGDTVRYEVQDNGIGIAAQDCGKLFEMFTRFHVGVAPGTGLGLSIVERIITMLNGQVGVESAPGEGSTFWFTLPAAPD